MAISQHVLHASKSIFVPSGTYLQAGESIPGALTVCIFCALKILNKNGIVCRVGKYIIPVLLLRKQLTTGSLQLSSLCS